MPRSVASRSDSASGDGRATTLLPPGGLFQPAVSGAGKERKPSVPKFRAARRPADSDGRGSTSSAGRRSQTSRSPDGHSTARTDRSTGMLAVGLDGVGGVGMTVSAGGAAFVVKSMSKDGPIAQNGMVKVGDSLVSVSGVSVRGMAQGSLQDIVLGEPASTVRLGLERSDKMTGRTFFYEISVQREEGAGEVPGLGEAAAAALELDLSPKTCSQSYRGSSIATLERSSDYLSARDSKPQSRDADNTPASSQMSVPFSMSRKLDAESVSNSRQNSARRLEGESMSRQSSARRAHTVSPWPTPLSARGLSTGPVDGGEAANPIELALALSKSAVDPYSVLGKRNQENLVAMAAEIELLQSQVAASRSEANEMKIRASEAEELARMETARRVSEEKLRLDASEREKKMHQQWIDEHEQRRDAEIKAEEIVHQYSRTDSQISALKSEVDSLAASETKLKAKVLKLENENRETVSRAATLESENVKLQQKAERVRAELMEAQAENAAMHKSAAQLKETTKKLEVAEAKIANRDRSGQVKINELKEANTKLQQSLDRAEPLCTKLRGDLDALQRKHTSALETLAQKKAQIECSQDVERQLNLQVEKGATEIKRLKVLNDALEKELEKLRGEMQSAQARRKLDKAQVAELRAKLDEITAEVESSSSDCQKEKLARSNQEERERHLQSAMLETEQRRRELDSRLWLLEERRKQDLNEFSQLREDYTALEARFAESEARLVDVTRQRDTKTADNTRLQDKITEHLKAIAACEEEAATLKRQLSSCQLQLSKMQTDLELAGKSLAARDEQLDELRQTISTLETDNSQLRKTASRLQDDLQKQGEEQRVMGSESQVHKSQCESLQDKAKEVAAQLESEKARRLAAEERERETRHAFTISQEALRTLEGKFEMTWQEHELLTGQAAKSRQEFAAASAQLKGQAEEIEEAQRLLRDATQMVELETSRRIAADDRERLATQASMAAELEKRELENKVWMLEERKRQDEVALEQIRGSFQALEDNKNAAMKELKAKTLELEHVKEKGKELASKFQLISNLKKEFEIAEGHRLDAEERFKAQEKELEDARQLARKTLETCRELSAKSKEDDAELERLNLELVGLQEKRLTSQQERLSNQRSQEHTAKQLRERLRDAEESLQVLEMRARKAVMEKGELEAELAHANQRIESLEHHADALMRHGSTQPTSSLDHDHALCGVGGTFQKSGGGFLVTGLDGGMDAMAGVSNNIPGNLKMGDLAIAMDDIPLADMSSIQFRNSIQGPHGTRVSLLIVRRDEGSGINMPPFDLVLTRRRWITAGAATDSAAPCSSLSIAATPHSPLAAQASAMSSADDLRDMPSPTPSTNTDFERATPAFQEIVQIFKMLDKNSDGRISHAEFLGGLRRYPWIADKLGIPAHIHQEDGTREKYQLFFGTVDSDDSKTVEFRELCRFYGYEDDGTLTLDARDGGEGHPGQWARAASPKRGAEADSLPAEPAAANASAKGNGTVSTHARTTPPLALNPEPPTSYGATRSLPVDTSPARAAAAAAVSVKERAAMMQARTIAAQDAAGGRPSIRNASAQHRVQQPAGELEQWGAARLAAPPTPAQTPSRPSIPEDDSPLPLPPGLHTSRR